MELTQRSRTSKAFKIESGNDLFPVFLKLQDLRLLIVGGGNVAFEKLNALKHNASKCNIRIVAKVISPKVQALARVYGAEIYERPYRPHDLQETDIVLVAVNDTSVSRTIHADARQLRILVNVADTPSLCDFYLGSIVSKGHLKIAISTNGKSPTMAKRIREMLEAAIPDEIDQVLNQMHVLRNQLKGDFDYKVSRLNHITRDLITKERGVTWWQKIAKQSVWAFVFLFLGFFIASFVPFAKVLRWGHDGAQSLGGEFMLMVAAGFAAQLVDGALGMGYGVTSTSILLGAGIPLPAISGSIHTAEMFSSAISGFTHYRFGNVNKKLLKALLIPGVVGAIAGAYMLSVYGVRYAVYVKPLLAVYTLFLGFRILLKAFTKSRGKKTKHVGLLAGAGGFLDSFGGGGWGPLVTSTLISGGRSPKYVIGTVSITEFFITLASALTFLSFMGITHWKVILGLVIGGSAAAPLAARLVGKLPQKSSFLLLGIMIMVWSVILIAKTI